MLWVSSSSIEGAGTDLSGGFPSCSVFFSVLLMPYALSWTQCYQVEYDGVAPVIIESFIPPIVLGSFNFWIVKNGRVETVHRYMHRTLSVDIHSYLLPSWGRCLEVCPIASGTARRGDIHHHKWQRNRERAVCGRTLALTMMRARLPADMLVLLVSACAIGKSCVAVEVSSLPEFLAPLALLD